jgi:hypothetical protein
MYPAPHSWAERAYPKLIHFPAVTATAALPIEGALPDLDGATACSTPHR